MRLLIDTETTDLRERHIVQLAAALFDGNWQRVGFFSTLIKPNGWTIGAEAEAIHGISEAKCSAYGVPLAIALAMLQGMAECAVQVVAHNVNFDAGVVKTNLGRIGANGLWWEQKAARSACTMLLSVEQCKIPSPNGRPGFKWPKLQEAFAHFYPDEPYEGGHDAEIDMMRCARIAQALEKRGLLPNPFQPVGPFRR